MVKKKVVVKKVGKKQVKVSALDRAKARWSTFGSGRKVLSIVLLAAAGYCLLYIGQVIVQKIQFDAEKRSIHKVYEQIINELGPPATGGVKSKCNYQHLKFSKGDRRCGTSLNIKYDVKNKDEATKITKLANAIITKDYSTIYISDPSLVFNEIDLENKSYRIGLDLAKGRNKSRCGAEYKYSLDDSTTVEKSGISKHLTLTLICYGDSNFEFFPVEE